MRHRCCARVAEQSARVRVITIPNSRRGHVAALHRDFSLRSMPSSDMANWTKLLQADFKSLEAYMLKKGEAAPNQSGRQEMLEHLINRYL